MAYLENSCPRRLYFTLLVLVYVSQGNPMFTEYMQHKTIICYISYARKTYKLSEPSTTLLFPHSDKLYWADKY